MAIYAYQYRRKWDGTPSESEHQGKGYDRRRKIRDGVVIVNLDRRQNSDPNYNGPERRSGLDRRSGMDRRRCVC